jgi:hypothetical protein
MDYAKFGVAFRIWLMAVLINTLTGTLLLSGYGRQGDILLLLLFYGTLFGLVVSLPSLPIIYMIVSYCIKRTVSAKTMFWTILISAPVIASLAWLLFVIFFGGSFRAETGFLPMAIFSGVAATATQYRSFKHLATYENYAFEEAQP